MKGITREKLLELIKSGLTRYQIADYFGCNYKTISGYKTKYKITEPIYPRKYRDSLDKDKIIELYINQKRTAKEVAAILQICTYTFRTKLKELGIKQRSRGDTSHLLNYKVIKVSDAELVELYKTRTFDQVVNYLKVNRLGDISSTTLSKRLKEIEIATGTKIIRQSAVIK